MSFHLTSSSHTIQNGRLIIRRMARMFEVQFLEVGAHDVLGPLFFLLQKTASAMPLVFPVSAAGLVPFSCRPMPLAVSPGGAGGE